MNPNKIELTEEQKQKALGAWNDAVKAGKQPPGLKELVELCWPGSGLDGRSAEGISLRSFLATRSIKPKSAFTYVSKIAEFELTPEQKEFISNNHKSMNITEMTRELFPQVKNLSNLSKEYRVIFRYLKSNVPDFKVPENEAIEPYSPPRNINTVIERVNKYVHGVNLQQEKLTTKQKNDLNALMSYLHSLRFTSSINLFKKLDERDLMESEFIRFTYDKGDLSAEEISSYVMLALEAPNMNRKQVEIERLSELLQNSAEDSEGKKVSIGLSDAIHNAESELDNCKKRQKDLIKVLVGNRSDRLKNKMAETRSVLSLVEAAKHKDMRDQMIKIAKKQEEILGKEVDRLADMDSLKASIFGISKDEILNG